MTFYSGGQDAEFRCCVSGGEGRACRCELRIAYFTALRSNKTEPANSSPTSGAAPVAAGVVDVAAVVEVEDTSDTQQPEGTDAGEQGSEDDGVLA